MNGRRLASLAIVVVSGIAIAIAVITIDRADRVAAIEAVRLGATLATCWFVWQGAVWPRWILGPLVVYGAYGFYQGAMRIGLTRPLGTLWLTLSILYLLSLAILLTSPSVRTYLAARRQARTRANAAVGA